MSTNKRAGKRSQQQQRPVFETIRKPVAPPGHPLSHAKPEERVHPAERKVKHKRPVDDTE